jgi:hypothetical protein
MVFDKSLIWAHFEMAMVQDETENAICVVLLEKHTELVNKLSPMFGIESRPCISEHGKVIVSGLVIE